MLKNNIMRNFTKAALFSFILIFVVKQLSAQEFYEDGSMKLTEVSTDKKYGYEANHKTAIKVGKIENEQAFLKSLLGPNGETVQFQRLGSCCSFKSKTAAFGSGFLDKYEVYYQGLKKPIILYLNGYDFENPKCPYGFTFKTADKIEKPYNFHKDSILHVEYCNNKDVFAVDKEALLNEKVGTLPVADENPIFEGGIEALKKYFAENPLTDERAKDLMFRVSIGFVVNCGGKAGNFQIITKGKGTLETLANQILEKVNKMPQNWKPAKKNGKAVDCYQVLSFSVLGGELNKVSYR
ncbi:hypothetical protein FACS1894178_2880 [Bacteroidia bacterium]|nr:hypothetical protein FACS1894178_2880 [Bacteroidia bacterium]